MLHGNNSSNVIPSNKHVNMFLLDGGTATKDQENIPLNLAIDEAVTNIQTEYQEWERHHFN